MDNKNEKDIKKDIKVEKKSYRKLRKILLALIDILAIAVSYYLTQVFLNNTFWNFDVATLQAMFNSVLLSVLVYEIFLNLFDVYKNITVYESSKEYFSYGLACLISCDVVSMLGIIFNLNILSAKENLLAGIFTGIIIISYRVVIRFILTNSITVNKNEEKRRNLLIIGGGAATRDIIKKIKESMQDSYYVVGIIDDDKSKLNCSIQGVKILGDRSNIIEVAKKYDVDVIFFSISSINPKDKKDILNICQNTGAKLRILPSTEDLIKNKNIMENLRDVEIEDILGRDPIVLDNNNISNLIEGHVVMVTGGGGSIGSELCRQIMKYNPKELVIVDIYENNLYDIELELKAKYKNIKIDAIVASVRDKKKLDNLFATYRPYLVFHAAAHKHVPLMETSPLEAIKNNVFGTYNVVNCCDKYNVKRFVLISTDKAVNPTNIMGASKRMCEMIVQAKNRESETEFAAVRFGNVLGSNGSVVPLFKKQIAAGGPVTVTHKEITRFFMTIPEAVQLVLQAVTYAKGGEIFVLDMGEPVKIYDLAVSLIKLSGLEPNVDIPIEITGLRPGEKLYEELLMSEEGLQKTAHNKIFIAEPLDINMEQITQKLDVLHEMIQDEAIPMKEIKHIIKEVVPTYKEETSH
mgnify:CR=1 FL=1